MNTLLKRIQGLTNLSETEMKIANYFETKYPAALTENINQISIATKTSVASVSRFVQKLGYDNFSDLKYEAGLFIEQRLISPIEKYNSKKSDSKSLNYGVTDHLAQCIENIKETSFRIDLTDFDNAVIKIIKAKNIYVVGGASANALANYFAIFARYLRPNINVLDPDISTLAHKLVDVKKGDVLIAITHYRVSKITTKVAKYFYDMGNDVIMVADRSVNPVAKFAAISLTVRSGGTPMFSSRVATLALLEAIINAMIPFCETDSKNRFEVMEKIFESYDVYSK